MATPVTGIVPEVKPVPPTAAVSGGDASSIEVPSGSSLPEKLSESSLQPPDEDAAVYDGRVIIFNTPQIASGDSANISRAGAVMAYHVQDAEFPAAEDTSDGITAVGRVRPDEQRDEEPREDASRVNPVRRDRYSTHVPQRERRPGVVAEDIMSSSVFSLNMDLSLEEAIRVFREHRFRHLPIVNSAERLVGIISDRDFIVNQNQPFSLRAPIREHMKSDVLTARPRTEIRRIAEVMIRHRIGCVPIVSEEGSLDGILTRSDILRAIVNHAPIELWT